MALSPTTIAGGSGASPTTMASGGPASPPSPAGNEPSPAGVPLATPPGGPGIGATGEGGGTGQGGGTGSTASTATSPLPTPVATTPTVSTTTEVSQPAVPLVASPDTVATSADTPVTLPAAQLLANDTAPTGQTLSLTAVSNAQDGTVSLDQAHGTVTFTPATGFTGAAGFQYQVTDTNGDTAQAPVTVNVATATTPTPTTSPTTVSPPPPPPVATNDTGTTVIGTPLTIPVAQLLVNDTAPTGQTLSVTGVSNAQQGTVALDQAHGTVVFTPAPGYIGPAGFQYQITDTRGDTAQAAVAVTVTPPPVPTVVNDAVSAVANTAKQISAVDLLANDKPAAAGDQLSVSAVSNPQHGSVALTPPGNVTFTPDSGFTGAAAFTYTVSEQHGGSASGQVQVNVVPPPPPTAVTDTLTGQENTATVIPATQLLGNDQATVPPNDPLHIAGVSTPQNATVELTQQGNVAFTPANGFAGIATFNYTVADDFHQAATGTVAVNVLAPPSPPPVPQTITENQIIQQTQQVEITQVQQISVNQTIVQQPPSNAPAAAAPAAASPSSTPLTPPPSAIVYFDGTSQAHGSELWSYNGQSVGEVADINPGPPSSFPANLQGIGNTLFFSADDGTHGRQPWIYDGQSAHMLADINPAGSSDPQDFTQVVVPVSGSAFAVMTEVYFSATDGTDGRQLWMSDLAGHLHMVTDINPGPVGADPANLTTLGGSLYFTANDGVHGSQLWAVAGNGAPRELTNLNTGPGAAGAQPDDLTVVGQTLYFIANDGTQGRELFSVTNNGAPVEQVIGSGSVGAFPTVGSDHDLVALNGKLYFIANLAGQGNVLMSESPGGQAPQLVANLGGGPNAGLGSVQAAAAGHDVYFSVTDGQGHSQLARYDTTTGNFTANIAPDSTDMPADLTAVGNQLFFTVLNHTTQGDIQFRDLYTDNGLTTQKVALGSAQTLPHNLVAANGMLFFADQGQLQEVNPQMPPLAATTLTVPGGQIYVPIDIAAVHGATVLG